MDGEEEGRAKQGVTRTEAAMWLALEIDWASENIKSLWEKEEGLAFTREDHGE